jgi:hypothetical protein
VSQLLPYKPPAPEVIQAIERLEQSDTFDEAAFAIVNQERWRSIPIVLGFMLPAAAIGALLVWLAESAGWLPGVAPFFYAFFPIVFAALVLTALRGDDVKDEMRLGKAIGRWEAQGGRIRDKPLERKS